MLNKSFKTTNYVQIMNNFRKLQDAYAKLGWAQDNIKHEGKVDKILIDEIKRLIHEFMVDNEPTPKGVFNIWDWVINDGCRPALEGVFHDKENKVAVATNAHMIVADADCYDESKADEGYQPKGFNMIIHRPVDRYGKFIDQRFPNWKSVIPQKSDDYIMHNVSLKELDKYIKECKAFMKLNGLTNKYAPTPIFKVGESFFHAESLRIFLVATGECIYINKKPSSFAETTKGMFWSDKRTTVIMPMTPNCDDLNEEAKQLGLYLLNKY